MNLGMITDEKDQIKFDQWCQELLGAGVGEIFVCSVDRDGTGFGFDFNLVNIKILNVPIIICSGAGSKEDVLNLVKSSNCDGVGIGSMFHYNYIKKVESKYMSYNSIN